MRRHLFILGCAGACMCMAAGEAAGQTGNDPILIETPADPPGYAQILRDVVVKTSLPGGGFETRVDYAKLAAARGQQKMRADIRRQFFSVDPSSLDDAARQAWAVNAYNFTIIDIVVEQLTKGKAVVSIADIGDGNFAVFDEPKLEVAGETYSLNQFESHFLFHDVNRKKRNVPPNLDPRFHFVLVCAAKGCPPLWPEPFLPEKLESQLDAATRNALSGPRQVQVDGKVVHVSKLFDWYRHDFDGHGGADGFLSRYGPAPAQAALREKGKVRADLDWDWSLNRP